MKIEFSKHCNLYKFLNDDVFIVFQNESYTEEGNGGESFITTLLEIKLLNKECFEEGIFFCEVTTIYFEPDWEENQKRAQYRGEAEDFNIELDEEDYGDISIERDRKIENAFGYYSFPTREQIERNEKELKENQVWIDAYDYHNQQSGDVNPEYNLEHDDPYRQLPFLGNEILERNFLNKINNDDLLKFSHFKKHLDFALGNINLQLKQAILDDKPIKGIGDAQQFIKKIKEDYEPLFKKSFEIKEKEKIDKENKIKKLLNEFGLD